MLSYFQKLWPDLDLVPEFLPVSGLMFAGSKVARSLSYIRKDGIRYGCTGNKRSQTDSLAFLSTPREGDPRTPVELSNFFIVQIPFSNKPPHVCALVRCLQSDDNIPGMPWDLLYVSDVIVVSLLTLLIVTAQQYLVSTSHMPTSSKTLKWFQLHRLRHPLLSFRSYLGLSIGSSGYRFHLIM